MKIVHGALAAAMLAGLAAIPAAPALAQNQRVIEIFGNDPCPSSNGEEIVVCRRLDEKERFRIPQQLRTTEVERGAQNTGVALADSMRSAAGQNLPNSCSAVGSNGSSGCFAQQARAARAEREQIANDVPVIDK